MNKFPTWMKLTLVAGVIATLIVTSAASFFSPSANTRNGVVYGYTAGKSISIRGFGRTLYEYNLTSKTQVLPTALASGVGPGAQVTVVAQCFTTSATRGCIALQIWVRMPAPAGGTAATSAPLPPVATPTP